MSSHAELVEVRSSAPLRIVVQPGGVVTEKVTLDMHAVDLVADLRAEIAVWWEGKVRQQCHKMTKNKDPISFCLLGKSEPI